MKVFVSGSLAYDRIMDFPGLFSDHFVPEKLHTINVSFMVTTLDESFGGTAGNIAYSLKLLGHEPRILSTTGKDFTPYRDWLTKNAIGTASIASVEKEKTACASVMTDKNDNQITAFYMGAMGVPYSLPVAPEKDAFGIVAPGNLVDMEHFASVYRESGMPFIFDPGQAIPALSAEALKNGIEGSRALMSNDYELALIMQKTGWSEEDILAHTEMLVTTLGKNGSRVRMKEKAFETPAAKPKDASDPTGAGDAYRAGFIHALSQGWPVETCTKFAAVVACYTIETLGTQNHFFTIEDTRARYKENFNEELPA